MPINYAKAGSPSLAKDILGNLSRGMCLAWCTMTPHVHVSKCSATSEIRGLCILLCTFNTVQIHLILFAHYLAFIMTIGLY